MPVLDIHGYLGASVVAGVSHTPASVEAGLVARGIDAAVVMSAHARRVDPLAGNRILSAMVEHATRLSACLVTHTNRPEASIEAMRELMGRRRFLAMAVTGSRPEEPVRKIVADEVLNAYRRFGKPLFLFTHNADGVAAGLEIARAYPMLRIVFIGMGGEDWRAAITAAHLATNVLLETSGAMDCAKITAAIEVIGAHRIVFGSGSPHTDAAAMLGMIDDARISDDVRNRIVWDNARRLFRLDELEADAEGV